ncbi:hypothetical protein BTJ66_06745 [Staphylococcus edaphicus]|uniref:Uncharacterized protein n=1 Tax=Staphylococcus edaphicus TaxID=1955013 RepID=A0A2C6WPU5_9STAP|nr:hypothetical protein BTJ66_06745 [Staphylococcus edaphicus]
MKRNLFFNRSAYMYPFMMVIFMLYLSLITIYTFQIGIQLKTLDNIESYYKKQINTYIKKDVNFE